MNRTELKAYTSLAGLIIPGRVKGRDVWHCLDRSRYWRIPDISIDSNTRSDWEEYLSEFNTRCGGRRL